MLMTNQKDDCDWLEDEQLRRALSLSLKEKQVREEKNGKRKKVINKKEEKGDDSEVITKRSKSKEDKKICEVEKSSNNKKVDAKDKKVCKKDEKSEIETCKQKKPRRKSKEKQVDTDGYVPRLTRLQKQLVSNYEQEQRKSPELEIANAKVAESSDVTADKKCSDVIKERKLKFRAQRKFAESSLLSSRPSQVKKRQKSLVAPKAAPKLKKPRKVSFYPRKSAPKNIICSGTVDATTFADFLCYRGTEFEPQLP